MSEIVAGDVPILSLASSTRQPSWLNRAGNVDRSACIELHAREVARIVFAQAWRSSKTTAGRISSANVIITASQLLDWLARRSPRSLIGDSRTPKSNAMKRPSDPKPWERRYLKPGDQPWRAATDDRGSRFANPNKGAAATKRIAHGLSPSRGDLSRRMPETDAWSQSLTIERWRLKSRKPRPASDKTNPPNPVHPFLLCPRCRTKRRMLLMPVAHEQELNDAHLAQSWLRFIDAHPRWRKLALNNAAVRTHIESLTKRYALLFAPRQFICIDCLGARYGEVKRSRRPLKPVITMPPPAPGPEDTIEPAGDPNELPKAFITIYKQLCDSFRRSEAVDEMAKMLSEADADEANQFDSALLYRILTAKPRDYSPILRAMKSDRRKRAANSHHP